LEVLADEIVLLSRLSNNGSRIDGTGTTHNSFAAKHWVIVFKRIVPVVIAERSLGSHLIRVNLSYECKLGVLDKRIRADRILHQRESLTENEGREE
jgi:hypothetical protein